MQRIDQLALDVRLETVQSDVGENRSQPREILLESGRPVDRHIAPPLQIEVGAVQNQNLHGHPLYFEDKDTQSRVQKQALA